jgi:predicted RNA-binding protein YlqC (UPF0109 family)
MIPSFQFYFPNVLDGINQKHSDLKVNVPCKNITQSTKNEITKNEITKNEITKNEITKNEITKIETEMMIDDKYLGKIIGRGGHKIDEIRTNSNTKITIYREVYNNKRRVVILGTQDDIQKAKTNILQLCY